jgi:lipopolysaccharide assembly outer membrane protein LptD (OstA)
MGALFLLCASSIYAKEAKSAKGKEFTQKAPIVVNGDRVEYFHEQKKVIGTGNVSIDYQDVKLTCDKVTVYLDTREAIAEGNVKITQKDTYFTIRSARIK